jgi:branched-chain amino acid transport system substrate-binding protein
LCGCQEAKDVYEPSGKVVKIGFVAPLSGENQAWGDNSLFGAKAALALQPFLLNGDRPEIVIVDDQNDPEKTRRAVKKLVEKEGVSAILLGSGSDTVLGVTNLIESYKVPSIALLATHPEITSGEYTAELSFDDSLQATVAALYVMDEMIVDRVTVFVDPLKKHSVSLADIFSKKFIEAGGQIETIEFPSNVSELEPILIDLKAKGEQLLYLPLRASEVVKIEKASRELGYDPKVMLSDGVLSRILLDHDDDLSLVEGMLATDMYSNVSLTEEYGKKLDGVYDASFTEPKTTYTALGAEGLSIFLAAMDRCGDSSDTDCINRNVHTTNNFVGVNSKITINRKGKTERPIYINTITNKKLVFNVMVY